MPVAFFVAELRERLEQARKASLQAYRSVNLRAADRLSFEFGVQSVPGELAELHEVDIAWWSGRAERVKDTAMKRFDEFLRTADSSTPPSAVTESAKPILEIVNSRGIEHPARPQIVEWVFDCHSLRYCTL